MKKLLLLWTVCATLLPNVFGQQAQYTIHSEKGDRYAPAIPHPLAWWTESPLRLDVTGDLMLGFKAPDGQLLTSHDYATEHQILPIGNLSGYKVIQLMTTIHPGPRVIAAGFARDSNEHCHLERSLSVLK